MSTATCIVLLALAVFFTPLVLARQMFDFSKGHFDGLENCSFNSALNWTTFEDAKLYPGGPNVGTVLSSESGDYNYHPCFTISYPVTLKRQSRIRMQFNSRLPMYQPMGCSISTVPGGGGRQWFSYAPQQEYVEPVWVEYTSSLLPSYIEEGDFFISFEINSSDGGTVSMRYFEVRDDTPTPPPCTCCNQCDISANPLLN